MVVSVVNMGLQATAARRIVADPSAVAVVERSILRVAYATSLTVGAALVVLSPAVAWLLQLTRSSRPSCWPAWPCRPR